jgi:hypothetical protein
LAATMATSAPPTLSTLPLFEKLEKLEQAQQESKKKGEDAAAVLIVQIRSTRYVVVFKKYSNHTYFLSSSKFCLRAEARRLNRATQEGIWTHCR